MMASSASARIDGRLCPPERFSPSPSRKPVANPKPTAIWNRVSCLTRFARTRERSPSGSWLSFSNSRPEMSRLSTESPRNSSRSLWSDVKLRWVSARSSRRGLANGCWRRFCSAMSSGFKSGSTLCTGPCSLGAARVLHHKEGQAHQWDFALVVERHHHPVTLLAHFQIFAGDGGEVINLSRLVKNAARLGHGGAL